MKTTPQQIDDDADLLDVIDFDCVEELTEYLKSKDLHLTDDDVEDVKNIIEYNNGWDDDED
jgi:hypothetical protein